MTIQLGPDERVNWHEVLENLRAAGMKIEAVAAMTGIPKSTLNGYKTLGAEPKHADGERLLALWRDKLAPALPVVTESIRQDRIRRTSAERESQTGYDAAGLVRAWGTPVTPLAELESRLHKDRKAAVGNPTT